jgi:hypothetical protein
MLLPACRALVPTEVLQTLPATAAAAKQQQAPTSAASTTPEAGTKSAGRPPRGAAGRGAAGAAGKAGRGKSSSAGGAVQAADPEQPGSAADEDQPGAAGDDEQEDEEAALLAGLVLKLAIKREPFARNNSKCSRCYKQFLAEGSPLVRRRLKQLHVVQLWPCGAGVAPCVSHRAPWSFCLCLSAKAHC